MVNANAKTYGIYSVSLPLEIFHREKMMAMRAYSAHDERPRIRQWWDPTSLGDVCASDDVVCILYMSALSRHQAQVHTSAVYLSQQPAPFPPPTSRPSQQTARRFTCTYLTVPIHKVIGDIPHDALVAIMQHALLCPLASSRIIGLEGARARVCARDGIAVVGPYCWISLFASLWSCAEHF
jgi:hypothetical protein